MESFLLRLPPPLLKHQSIGPPGNFSRQVGFRIGPPLSHPPPPPSSAQVYSGPAGYGQTSESDVAGTFSCIEAKGFRRNERFGSSIGSVSFTSIADAGSVRGRMRPRGSGCRRGPSVDGLRGMRNPKAIMIHSSVVVPHKNAIAVVRILDEVFLLLLLL